MLIHLALTLIAAFALASGVAAQPVSAVVPSPVEPASAVQTDAAALAQDAAAYARLVDVPPPQAERQWRMAAASVAITDALKASWRERLAGIAVEHRPAFRIVVLLTGDAPVDDQLVLAGGETVPVVYRVGATATLTRLQAALAEHQAAIRAALPHPPGMGIDQRTGELVIVVARADVEAIGTAELATRLAGIAGVPVRLRSIDEPGLDQAAEGGTRLIGGKPGDPRRYVCTAGFAVTDGSRDGIATAAHCPDALSWFDAAGQEHPLDFVGQWGWGFQDVQINASDVPLAPLFHVDPARTWSREVTGQRAAASTRAGDVVCHRGERTGYSCAAVELTDFAPAGDLCGGACSPTWITVAGPHCGGGDSGAPVFVGGTALGLLKGGSYRADGGCGFYFYMPIDYLPTGWRLLTRDDPPLARPVVDDDSLSPVTAENDQDRGRIGRSSQSTRTGATRRASALARASGGVAGIASGL